MHDPSVLPQEIRAFLEGENAYHEAVMADTKALQDKLFAEIKGRIKEDDSSVPAPDGPFDYYSALRHRRTAPALLPQAARRRTARNSCCSTAMRWPRAANISASAAWTCRPTTASSPGPSTATARNSTSCACATRRRAGPAPTCCENTAGDAIWAADGKSFFYTLQDDNHRPLKTFRHVLGTTQSDDVLVYEEKDTGKFTGVGKTNSEQWIAIDIHDHDTSEVWLIDAAKPDETPAPRGGARRRHRI